MTIFSLKVTQNDLLWLKLIKIDSKFNLITLKFFDFDVGAWHFTNSIDITTPSADDSTNGICGYDDFFRFSHNLFPSGIFPVQGIGSISGRTLTSGQTGSVGPFLSCGIVVVVWTCCVTLLFRRPKNWKKILASNPFLKLQLRHELPTKQNCQVGQFRL